MAFCNMNGENGMEETGIKKQQLTENMGEKIIIKWRSVQQQ